MTSSTITAGYADEGVSLDNGQYSDPVTVISTATINSNYYGVYAKYSAWAIVNQGDISATRYGIFLKIGGAVSNAIGGTITGSDGVAMKYGAGTVENAGLIGGVRDGVFLKYGGDVFNAPTGTITGHHDGVEFSFSGPNTVENAGTITGGTSRYEFAVYLGGGGAGRLIIDPGAVFNGNVLAGGGGNTIELKAGAGAGVLDGLGGKYAGFGTVTIDSGASWTIAGTQAGLNGETIDGLSGSNSLDITDLGFVSGSTSAVLTDGTLAVTAGTTTVDITLGTADGQKFYVHNDGAGGVLVDDLKQQITGTYASGIVLTPGSYFSSVSVTSTGTVNGPGDGISAATAWTIVNQGSIGGTSGDGVDLHAGGLLSNASGGTITGGDGYAGVHVYAALGTVENAGSIYGGNDGVELDHGGLVSNASTGTITGGSDGVELLTVAGTVENAGTITGDSGTAVHFSHAGDRLIVDAGAVFNGNVSATGTGNTIELTTGASVGVLNGLGGKYQHFQTVTIDSGAAWDIAGTITGIGTTAIDGFNSHDRIDLTNLTFAMGDTVTLDSGTDLLTIKNSGGSTLATLHFDSNVTGDTFQLLDDNSGGSFVEESGYTPCYLKGTRVLTERGHVAVEHLKIGDRLMTLTGEDLPIKWIGRRSYRDWLAVGNLDVQPILFKAGSIADGVPTRDLYVSPEHAMFLDGVLVPALHLVNGISILKVEGMEEIEYFHFEFDRHVVIYAESAPAESFVDDDSRMLFHNADEYRRLYPDEPCGRYTEFCAPRVETGSALDALHCSLAARAAQLLPDGTAAPAAVQQGYLDRATRSLVEGWAFAGMGEGPVRLAILVNGAVVGQTVADRYRAGLGVGDGHCGFRFALPDGLSPDLAHRIEVRRESDWSLLRGGRVTLEPDHKPAAMPPHPAGMSAASVA